MKILLIQPTLTWLLPEGEFRRAIYEPLGLAYLAATARRHGHDPVILDCVAEGDGDFAVDDEYTRVGMRDEAIAARIAEINPDLIGMTCQFTGFDRDGRRIAALAKSVLPNVPVIVGGADASARAGELSRDPNIDLVVRGEGEGTLVALLERYDRESRLPNDLPGTTVDGNDNPVADEVGDIDALPLPARDLLRMEVYLTGQTVLMPYAKRMPIGFMISSRGCPYNCIFCSTTKVWRRWRPRGPQFIVDEIEHFVTTYGVREIAFQDDSFLVDPDRIGRMCEDIVRRGLDITWTVPPGITPNRLSEDLLRVMKASGFYRACFPIESGDPETLEWIRKPIDLEDAENAIELCHRLGIWTYGNFIIGFPEQTGDSIEKTADYAEHCGLDMLSVYIAQPYAGSDMYEIFRKMDLLDPEKAAGSTVFHTLYDTKYFTAAELRAKRDEIYGRFMKRRIRRVFTPKGFRDLWRKMNTPENFAYAARIIGTLAKNTLHEGSVNLLGSMAKKNSGSTQD